MQEFEWRETCFGHPSSHSEYRYYRQKNGRILPQPSLLVLRCQFQDLKNLKRSQLSQCQPEEFDHKLKYDQLY